MDVRGRSYEIHVPVRIVILLEFLGANRFGLWMRGA
jgi:hypothetical protein